jgi:tetratricopeptide (TPR) repeat protein
MMVMQSPGVKTKMNNFREVRPVRTLASTLVFLLLCTNSPARANPLDCAAPEVTGSMTERTYSVLSRAMDDMGNNKLAEAATSLQELSAKVDGYELALVFQTLGHVRAQQDDLAGALRAFEDALATGALPRKVHEEMLLNTGQLYLASGNFDKGIETIRSYMAIYCGTPGPEVHMALASALAEKTDYAAALAEVETALGKTDTPDEQWLQFKLALHFELRQFVASAETLLLLIVMAPGNDQYWRQLSGVMLEIEQADEALAVLALAERQGFVKTEREVRNLANLYLMLEIPYKAAALLDRALDAGTVEPTAANYEYLSEAWISAREWSLAETALGEAAALAGDGRLWQRLAQVRMEREDWPGARQAVQRAIDAGVPDSGEAYYLLGITAYNSGDVAAAIAALQTAVSQPSFASEAQQWLKFLQEEQRRLAALDAPANTDVEGSAAL